LRAIADVDQLALRITHEHQAPLCLISRVLLATTRFTSCSVSATTWAGRSIRSCRSLAPEYSRILRPFVPSHL
jgi:hypothetical protein